MKTIKLLMQLSIMLLIISCNNDDDNVPQNQAPVLEDLTMNISENLTSDIITTIVATDAENDALTYSIVSQTPAGSVGIEANTGRVYVTNASAFDYDSNQIITVNIMVSDGVNETTSQLVINIIED